MINYKSQCATCGSSEGELSSLNFGKRFHMSGMTCAAVLKNKNTILQDKINAHIEHIKMLQNKKMSCKRSLISLPVQKKMEYGFGKEVMIIQKHYHVQLLCLLGN